jgi:hypothetical protein
MNALTNASNIQNFLYIMRFLAIFFLNFRVGIIVAEGNTQAEVQGSAL